MTGTSTRSSHTQNGKIYLGDNQDEIIEQVSLSLNANLSEVARLWCNPTVEHFLVPLVNLIYVQEKWFGSTYFFDIRPWHNARRVWICKSKKSVKDRDYEVNMAVDQIIILVAIICMLSDRDTSRPEVWRRTCAIVYLYVVEWSGNRIDDGAKFVECIRNNMADAC